MSEPQEQKPVEQLVKEYRPRLKSFIRRWVPNKEDAEDVLQDVFYQLVKTLDNNAVQIGQLSAWLFRVARNTIINMGRKKREEELPALGFGDEEDTVWEEFSVTLFDDDNPTPEAAYLRSLVWQELEAALAELPPEQREVFELTELEGMSVKEIAKATGTPVNTLLSRKHYAVKHLRHRLKELYKDILEY